MRSGEVVTEQRERSGSIASFADAQNRAYQEKLHKVAGQTSQHRRNAPDAHAQADNILAYTAVGPDAQWQRSKRIDKKKRRSEQTLLQRSQAQIGMNLRQDRREYIAVGIIQHIYNQKHCKGEARLSPCWLAPA